MILAILGFLELLLEESHVLGGRAQEVHRLQVRHLLRALSFDRIHEEDFMLERIGIGCTRASGSKGRCTCRFGGRAAGGAFIVAGCVHACKICVCVYTIETMPVVSESITRTFIPPTPVTILHT